MLFIHDDIVMLNTNVVIIYVIKQMLLSLCVLFIPNI